MIEYVELLAGPVVDECDLTLIRAVLLAGLDAVDLSDDTRPVLPRRDRLLKDAQVVYRWLHVGLSVLPLLFTSEQQLLGVRLSPERVRGRRLGELAEFIS